MSWETFLIKVAEYFQRWFIKKYFGEASSTEVLDPQPQVLLSVKDYCAELTNLVTRHQAKKSLYVSVGEADFLYAWLTRIYREANAGFLPRPQIERLIIRHPSQSFINQNQTLLRPDFEERMNLNIRGLRDDPVLQCELRIEVQSWPADPPFHGYLFGERILFGEWATSPEKQVKTVLADVRKSHPISFDLIERQFQDYL